MSLRNTDSEADKMEDYGGISTDSDCGDDEEDVSIYSETDQTEDTEGASRPTDHDDEDVSTDSDSDDDENVSIDSEDTESASTDSETDDREDVLKVSKNDGEQGLSQLHLAAESGETEAVCSLLMSSVNIDVMDAKQNTPLHYASLNGRVDVANLLLSKNANVDFRNASGQTSLHLASKKGHLAIAQLLLKSNADVNAVCRRQATPLHLAAKRGHAEIVENLILNGANVNAINKAKMTPLHLTCQNGHTSIVEILLDNNATVDVTKQSEETPFYLAAKNGHADIADLLLRRGVCDFVLINKYLTPLHVAVEEGHTKVVEVILKHSCRIFDKLAKDGKKLEENAKNVIDTKDVMPVQLLKSDGRSVSAAVVWAEKNKPLEIWEDSRRRIALELAVLFIKPKMVQVLLNVDQCAYSEDHLGKCFDILIHNFGFYEIKQVGDNKETGKVRSNDEQYEMRCENIKEIARALINSSKFNVNLQTDFGESFLQRIMTSIDSPEVRNCMDLHHAEPSCEILRNYLIQLLLEKGADFNIKDGFGITPLMIASRKGCFDAIQILFDWEQKSGKKLEIGARDGDGATALIKAAALMKAAERNHVSVIRLLLNHKPSVNTCDYYGFTALHAAVYEPNRNWFDLHFFCDGLRKRNFCSENCLKNSSKGMLIVDPNREIDQVQKYLEYNKETTRFREEVVKLLLANDETDVNAIDIKGNTPLDFAVRSSNQITSATFEALENRGAFRKSKEPEDKAPIEEARVDERGRNPLHRLIISRISDFSELIQSDEREQSDKRFDLMVYGMRLRPENFRESATATDDKGRTPLHYAVMQEYYEIEKDIDLVRLLLEIGSNVNAADMYGKTPLHYAEMNDQDDVLVQYGADEDTKDKHGQYSKMTEMYKLLVHYGANECANDKFGYTPRDLKQLRESVIINETNAKEIPIGKKVLYPSIAINSNHVTELSKRKLVKTIRIYSQSPRPQESSEEAIWKIWTENEVIRLNRRLSQLKPLIQHFIERLADGIKERDWRFECQPILVGSAEEETKATISADFDFNFKLIKFSELCEAFPHPLGPKGYFQLRRKTNADTKDQRGEKFDSFFDLDPCLLTNELNFRFKIILEEVLIDPAFWQDEHLFDWGAIAGCSSIHRDLDGLCKTLELRMIHPIEDGEGGFLLVDISTDIAACVHVKDWWSEVSLPVGIISDVETNGCTFVFDEPSFCRSKLLDVHSTFSKTFARISFAPLESRIIKESSPLIKAAYIVCKMILYSQSGTTYQLKTCLLFCMEALNARNGSDTRNEDEITPKQLLFWVERIMFCFLEFSRHDVYPCYFMPSFKQYVEELSHDEEYLKRRWRKDNVDVSSEVLIPFSYPVAYDYYLDLCPDDTTIDIPIVQWRHGVTTMTYPDANSDPEWDQFDRKELIRTLSSRSVNN